MSLYYEAAAVLANPGKIGGSLKSRIYKNNDVKSSPAQLFALITETAKWSVVLRGTIEKCGLLAEERKLTPILALLLTHDLLLSRHGVAAPTNHVLKLAIMRHKARLSAEFTKARIRAGHPTLEAFREAVNNGELEAEHGVSHKATQHPRWVRVNTLITTLEQQLSRTFGDYVKVENLGGVLSATTSSKVFFEDSHIPNLLAFPPKIDLGKSPAYHRGEIIFQDKASCFPAYLLDITQEDGDAIDGCAAPGNKTTHLAAIISDRKAGSNSQKIFAFEKDKARTSTLQKMVKRASAEHIVLIKGDSDFLAANPDADEFTSVGAILLDPSCSGSGIVGRDDTVQMHLPSVQSPKGSNYNASKGRKRKREAEHMGDPSQNGPILKLDLDDAAPEETAIDEKLSERLTSLSAFQLRILTHAMRFPKAHKITYSTCSIHFEENEGVVAQALASCIAKERGWKILKREHQVKGLKAWGRRGYWEDGKLDTDVQITGEQRKEFIDACIRCEKGTEEGTMGFFVAAFVRKEGESASQGTAETSNHNKFIQNEEEEWKGFSDDGGSDERMGSLGTVTKAETKGRKRKRRKGHSEKATRTQ